MQFLNGRILKSQGIRRRLTIAAVIAGGAVLGGIGIGGHGLAEAAAGARSLLTQGIGKTAWRQALADQPMHRDWPWETAAASHSLQNQTVRQLGFSAVLNGSASIDPVQLAELTRADRRDRLTPQPAVMTGSADAGTAEQLAVGDRITVVTPDGLSHLYKVTAREASPDGLKAKPGKAVATGKLQSNCSTLSSFVAGAMRLVIEAVQSEPGHRPQTAPEQKL